MTTNQTAIIIRESIREAAKTHGCKPSAAHRPSIVDSRALAARNQAIKSAYAQGVTKHALADAFGRTMQTILSILRRSPAPGECPRCGCADPAECRDRCGSAPAGREFADIDGTSLV